MAYIGCWQWSWADPSWGLVLVLGSRQVQWFWNACKMKPESNMVTSRNKLNWGWSVTNLRQANLVTDYSGSHWSAYSPSTIDIVHWLMKLNEPGGVNLVQISKKCPFHNLSWARPLSPSGPSWPRLPWQYSMRMLNGYRGRAKPCSSLSFFVLTTCDRQETLNCMQERAIFMYREIEAPQLGGGGGGIVIFVTMPGSFKQHNSPLQKLKVAKL